MHSHKVQIWVNNYIFQVNKNRLSVWDGVPSVVCKPIFLHKISSIHTIHDNNLLNKCINILKHNYIPIYNSNLIISFSTNLICIFNTISASAKTTNQPILTYIGATLYCYER